jgi:hypothetical protein
VDEGKLTEVGVEREERVEAGDCLERIAFVLESGVVVEEGSGVVLCVEELAFVGLQAVVVAVAGIVAAAAAGRG